MMGELFLLIVLAVVAAFGFVVLFGAPFLPSMKRQATTALDLLDLRSGQTLLELGCGDGRVMKRAAARGLKVIGYEINPMLALAAWIHTRKYGSNAKVVWGNYWRRQWPEADGIYVFLLDPYMTKLDKKIIRNYKGKHVKLASIAFEIPGRKAAKAENGVFLYKY